MSKNKWLLLALVCLSVGLVFFIVLYGQVRHEVSILKDYNQKLEAKDANLMAQMASLDARLFIKAQAYESLKQGMAEKTQKNVEIVRQLDFYRLILAPEEKKQGLALHAYQLTKVNNDQAKMTLTLVNFDKKHNRLNAELHISVSGLLNGQQKKYDIKGLLKQGQHFNSKVSFKFYANIEEQLVFPQGFVPTTLHLSATLNKKPFTWRESVEWVWEK